MRRLLLFTFCSILAAIVVFCFKKRVPTTVAEGDGLVVPREWLVQKRGPLTPAIDIRPADQTFLTFPEWFLVFSPEEQAEYFKKNTSTTFPYLSHTAQIWESYKIVNDQIKDNFPANDGSHFMIWVIGVSASVEYGLKSWYEAVIGRLTDTKVSVTEEDVFNAAFTRSYVDFIKDRPWYEYDFKRQLGILSTNVPAIGDHFVRKLERRYILTSELIVKYLYGKLIGMGTQQVYEEALPTTSVILSNDSLCVLPRYDDFAAAAIDLSRSGFSFKEIAGNNSAILVTTLLNAHRPFKFEKARMLFTQPLPSQPAIKRLALVVPVAQLSDLLLALDSSGLKPEHVFDY